MRTQSCETGGGLAAATPLPLPRRTCSQKRRTDSFSARRRLSICVTSASAASAASERWASRNAIASRSASACTAREYA